MFFLPKCYKWLEYESSLLSGWCEENLKKLNDFSRFTKEKKEKNCFFIFLESLQFFSTLSFTSFHQPYL